MTVEKLLPSSEEIREAIKLIGKKSTAPDKETPNWMEADIKNGIEWALNFIKLKAPSSKEVESEEKVCVCGVPNYLHTTCCGWQNANLIIFPKNEKEVEWQKMKLAATNSEIRITKDGVFVSSGIFVSQPTEEQTKEVSNNPLK